MKDLVINFHDVSTRDREHRWQLEIVNRANNRQANFTWDPTVPAFGILTMMDDVIKELMQIVSAGNETTTSF